MIDATIKVTIKDSEDAFNRIQLVLQDVPGGVQKATLSIIKRATETARSASLDGITTVYDIKPQDVTYRKNTTINVKTQSFNDGVVGMISYSGFKIPLYRFGVSHKKPKGLPYKVIAKTKGGWAQVNPGAPVKARQKKANPMKTIKTAFIATMTSSSDHTGIFSRENRYSSKITEIMGASTAQMAGDTLVLEKVEKEVLQTIEKHTEYEISRILNGYGR